MPVRVIDRLRKEFPQYRWVYDPEMYCWEGYDTPPADHAPPSTPSLRVRGYSMSYDEGRGTHWVQYYATYQDGSHVPVDCIPIVERRVD